MDRPDKSFNMLGEPIDCLNIHDLGHITPEGLFIDMHISPMSNPNRLNRSRVYLSGAMENDRTRGKTWRQEITEFLKTLGIIVLDPTDKAVIGGEVPSEDIDKAKGFRERGEYDQLAKMAKEIRATDLRMCDICDFAIVYLDNDINTCGTWEELFWLNRMKKPCLIYIKQGLQKLPLWLFGAIPFEHLFESWYAMKNHLYGVNQRGNDQSDRWRLFSL